jgi:hypothetical protein
MTQCKIFLYIEHVNYLLCAFELAGEQSEFHSLKANGRSRIRSLHKVVDITEVEALVITL